MGALALWLPLPESRDTGSFGIQMIETFVSFVISLENRKGGGSRAVLVRLLDCVIPAWSAGIQADMDVSGRILHTWMPAIHAGMTKLSIFMFCGRA